MNTIAYDSKEKLVAHLAEYLAMAEADDINSVAIVCGRRNRGPRMEFLLLEDSSEHELLSALHVLATNIHLWMLDRELAPAFERALN